RREFLKVHSYLRPEEPPRERDQPLLQPLRRHLQREVSSGRELKQGLRTRRGKNSERISYQKNIQTHKKGEALTLRPGLFFCAPLKCVAVLRQNFMLLA